MGTIMKVSALKLKKMSVLDLMNEIVELTDDSRNFVTDDSKPYCKELMMRLALPTMKHASLLSVFINLSHDSNISISDIAHQYDIRNIKVLTELDTIDWLAKNNYIGKRKTRSGDVSYHIKPGVLSNLREGKTPEKKIKENMTAIEFINTVDDMREAVSDGDCLEDDFMDELNELMDANSHLKFVKKWKEYCPDNETLMVYIIMSIRCIMHQDDHIVERDLEDYFDRHELFSIVENLGDGTHSLMKQGLVENCIEDGQADPHAWKLTDKSKYEVYEELKIKAPVMVKTGLILSKDIKAKSLYYNDKVSKQVQQFSELIDKDKMHRILKRMEDKGMRKGFTCLFYGGPGTGKTETVMQLARTSGRDIMLVDIPSIRSKWVGETEKNIKQIFVRYKDMVKESEKQDMPAPILVFNEADAILNKRLEGGTNAVDKMENAMQNILLQELETLEGILIATTNLTGSLDAAFERRFLYKIEFEKPTPKERKHIWKAMLGDLTDEQALELAEHFDFSGGQIENIARKRIINDIIAEKDALDMQDIIDTCKHELLNAKGERRRIGFV